MHPTLRLVSSSKSSVSGRVSVSRGGRHEQQPIASQLHRVPLQLVAPDHDLLERGERSLLGEVAVGQHLRRRPDGCGPAPGVDGGQGGQGGARGRGATSSRSASSRHVFVWRATSHSCLATMRRAAFSRSAAESVTGASASSRGRFRLLTADRLAAFARARSACCSSASASSRSASSSARCTCCSPSSRA